MKEWFKKHLGLLGFLVWGAFTLIEFLWRFILKIDHYDLAEIGFVLWVEAAFIQGILNEKYYTNILKKLKMVLLYLALLFQLD